MSRRSPIPGEAPEAPRRVLRDEAGHLRPGWALMVRIAGYFALAIAARLGLGALLHRLFTAWNLTPDTVARAPAWAAALYVWQGSVVTLAVDLIVIAYVRCLCRTRLPRPAARAWLTAWSVGTGIALLSDALFLLTDSLRLTWPLGQPRLTPGLPALWGLTLLTALAEELFTKGVVYDALRRRSLPGAVIAAALLLFLVNGGYSGTVVSGANVLLMGVFCALLYERFGLWAPVGFRWGWSFTTVFLLGRGGDRSVYGLYGVSESLLTGGDAGLVYGLWLTLLLSVLLCFLVLHEKNGFWARH